MKLPDHLIAKLRDQGLIVAGPWQEGARGWWGRFTLSKGPWIEGDIRLLPEPIVWIYEEEGFWFAEKSEFNPAQVCTDFPCKHDTAEEVVDAVLRFYCLQANVK